VILLALVPAALLVLDGVTGGFGANPIEEVTHRTGLTALILLLTTLAVTPVQRLVRVGALIRLRRTFGLLAFFYASLHLTTYAVDQTYLSGLGVSPAAIAADIRERPYITVGFLAFLLLVPLAVTSTRGWIKRLGGKRWQGLHRMVYAAAGLVVLHFLWLVKADMRPPLIAAGVLAVLLSYRLLHSRWPRRRKREVRVRAPAPAAPHPSA
jgi:sulfoxide reductase heme-binding subunit YedZ